MKIHDLVNYLKFVFKLYKYYIIDEKELKHLNSLKIYSGSFKFIIAKSQNLEIENI